MDFIVIILLANRRFFNRKNLASIRQNLTHLYLKKQIFSSFLLKLLKQTWKYGCKNSLFIFLSSNFAEFCGFYCKYMAGELTLFQQKKLSVNSPKLKTTYWIIFKTYSSNRKPQTNFRLDFYVIICGFVVKKQIILLTMIYRRFKPVPF